MIWKDRVQSVKPSSGHSCATTWECGDSFWNAKAECIDYAKQETAKFSAYLLDTITRAAEKWPAIADDENVGSECK